MPARTELVAEAIARLDTAGLRSQLLELDTPTLRDLGLWLTDREMTVAQAHRLLCDALGQDGGKGPADGEDSVDYKAVHRFAANFRGIYQQVRAEHARRIARLSVADATQGNVDLQARVLQSRLMELVAEKVVETSNLEELSGSEISAVIQTAMGYSNAQLKREELALKVAEGERKGKKLEAELALLRQKVLDLPAKVKAVQDKLAALERTMSAGGKIDRALFGAIRDELVALAAPGIEEARKPA